VTSSVIVIKMASAPALPADLIRPFLDLVRAGFTQPRKTLLNSLAQGLDRPKLDLQPVLARAGVNPELRPADLDLDAWLGLYDAAANA
jgi:16S rRNA (adenine1518-N6/adenine1519-N6)-dimethyltransferase